VGRKPSYQELQDAEGLVLKNGIIYKQVTRRTGSDIEPGKGSEISP